jgi:hypothetical protein
LAGLTIKSTNKGGKGAKKKIEEIKECIPVIKLGLLIPLWLECLQGGKGGF